METISCGRAKIKSAFPIPSRRKQNQKYVYHLCTDFKMPCALFWSIAIAFWNRQGGFTFNVPIEHHCTGRPNFNNTIRYRAASHATARPRHLMQFILYLFTSVQVIFVKSSRTIRNRQAPEPSNDWRFLHLRKMKLLIRCLCCFSLDLICGRNLNVVYLSRAL